MRKYRRVFHLIWSLWFFCGLILSGDLIQVRAQSRQCALLERPRIEQLVEANLIATHAYQILLAEKSEGEDAACYTPAGKSRAELEAIVVHQTELLKTDAAAVKTWAQGKRSVFDAAKDLEPILCSGLRIPENAPVNVYLDYLQTRSGASRSKLLPVASLHQTILEVDRDGDLLQQQLAFYKALGLPIYLRDFKIQGDDATFLQIGQELEKKTCASPFKTTAADWQIAGRKIWNWAEKYLHVRDGKMLAVELLKEREVKRLIPKIRALPAQKIAVVGHSFTMGQHWSSPSSFVPIVAEIFRRENPNVEFRQFERGGLTAFRARQQFYQNALDWKPDKVLLVVILRRDEDYEALRQMSEGFRQAGIKVYMFDRLNDPANLTKETAARNSKAARAAGIEIVEVSEILDSAPERGAFLSLDRIHMTEPYHRLMAKEWLRFLVGARRSSLQTTEISK